MRTHQGALRAFLRRLTRDAALADDLAQDTFLKAYKSQTSLNDPKKVQSWLFQIGYRTFLDAYRKTSRQDKLMPDPDLQAVAIKDPILSTDLEAAMNDLSEECRAVVILCLGHGMSHSEASTITELPLGTVKSHVSRGKAKLRAFLSVYETAE